MHSGSARRPKQAWLCLAVNVCTVLGRVPFGLEPCAVQRPGICGKATLDWGCCRTGGLRPEGDHQARTRRDHPQALWIPGVWRPALGISPWPVTLCPCLDRQRKAKPDVRLCHRLVDPEQSALAWRISLIPADRRNPGTGRQPAMAAAILFANKRAKGETGNPA